MLETVVKFALTLVAVAAIATSLHAQTARTPVRPTGPPAPAPMPGGSQFRKGWDGTVKGNHVEVFSTARALVVVFPNDLVYSIDAATGAIAEADSSILRSVLGTPIGGIIVKGGKNPGGQMRAINESGVSVRSPTRGKGKAFMIPADWTDGGYQLQVINQRAGANGTAAARTNAPGTEATFMLTKTAATFEMHGRTARLLQPGDALR